MRLRYGVFITKEPIRNPVLALVWRVFRVPALLGVSCSMFVLVGVGSLFGAYAVLAQGVLLGAMVLLITASSVQLWRAQRTVYIEFVFAYMGLCLAAFYIVWQLMRQSP